MSHARQDRRMTASPALPHDTLCGRTFVEADGTVYEIDWAGGPLLPGRDQAREDYRRPAKLHYVAGRS